VVQVILLVVLEDLAADAAMVLEQIIQQVLQAAELAHMVKALQAEAEIKPVIMPVAAAAAQAE
jgi:hypothetical protein